MHLGKVLRNPFIHKVYSQADAPTPPAICKHWRILCFGVQILVVLQKHPLPLTWLHCHTHALPGNSSVRGCTRYCYRVHGFTWKFWCMWMYMEIHGFPRTPEFLCMSAYKSKISMYTLYFPWISTYEYCYISFQTFFF